MSVAHSNSYATWRSWVSTDNGKAVTLMLNDPVALYLLVVFVLMVLVTGVGLVLVRKPFH